MCYRKNSAVKQIQIRRKHQPGTLGGVEREPFSAQIESVPAGGLVTAVKPAHRSVVAQSRVADNARRNLKRQPGVVSVEAI